jgi:uncharacterized RDD family membrane protein YckC
MPLHIVRRMTTSFCTQCGASLLAGSKFCTNCGATLGSAPASTVPVTMPSGYGAGAAAAPAYAPVVAAPRPGGFWIRFVAAIIDAIVVQVIVIPLSFVVGLIVGLLGGQGQGTTTFAGFLGAVVGLVVPWIYEAAMTSSEKQATLGKLAVGLKVVGEDGGRISFARATGRWAAKIVSTLTLLIGYIMAGFTDRKRALHDMLAGTYVVYKN